MPPLTTPEWDYASETVPAILMATSLQRNTWVAEIEAGSGILTRHLIGRFNYILAVESNPTLREIGIRRFGHLPSYCSIQGSPSSTNWLDNSIDIIISAQSINSFNPEPAVLQEFRRILRPPAWFVLINIYLTDEHLSYHLQRTFLKDLFSVFFPSSPLDVGLLHFYYSGGNCSRMAFPMMLTMTWAQFIGHLRIASRKIKTPQLQEDYAPKSGTILKYFEERDRINLQMPTEVYVGKI